MKCPFPSEKRRPDEKEHQEGDCGGGGELQENAGVTNAQPLPCLPSRHLWNWEKSRKREGRAWGSAASNIPWASPPHPQSSQQDCYTRIPSRSSAVGSASRSLSPLGAGRRPAPTRRHAWSREGAGSVLPLPTPVAGFACAVPKRAGPSCLKSG